MKNNALDITALVLVVVGAINWGLVGAFEYNLVDSLFGEGSGLSRVIYVIVGVAGIYMLLSYFISEPRSDRV